MAIGALSMSRARGGLRAKLLGAFGVVLVFLAVVAAVSAVALARIEADARLIAENRLPGLHYAEEARIELLGAQRNMVLALRAT